MALMRTTSPATGSVPPRTGISLAFHQEKTMAVIMIVMVVLLVMAGPNGHMGSHGKNDPPTQSTQPHEHDAAKSDTERR